MGCVMKKMLSYNLAAVAVLAVRGIAEAQQPKKVPLIGFYVVLPLPY